jgi:hypothetical protein
VVNVKELMVLFVNTTNRTPPTALIRTLFRYLIERNNALGYLPWSFEKSSYARIAPQISAHIYITFRSVMLVLFSGFGIYSLDGGIVTVDAFSTLILMYT